MSSVRVPLEPWIAAGGGIVLSIVAMLVERDDRASIARLAALESAPQLRSRVVRFLVDRVVQSSRASAAANRAAGPTHPGGDDLAPLVNELVTILAEGAPS